MLLLVISRILSPGSKRKAFNEKNNYFERFSFTLADIYRALSHFARLKQDTLRHIHEYVRKVYARDTSIIYYDTTNYYFEIDKQDDLRRRGVSKEHRPNPIVQMGLAMDRDGVPVSYGIFPGNLHDSQTFMNVIGEVRRNYETGRIIVVGDMGMITGDNIWYLINGKPDNPLNGYVFSFSVRGGTNDFKEYVLNSDGYKTMDGKIVDDSTNFMIKTRRTPRKIDVTSGNGKTTKKTVHEKQVVFWNRKYADKAKTDRETTLRKAAELIKDPSKYKRATHYGAAKFLHGIDRETGEISPKQIVALDLDAVAEAEKYDGYYAIVTSEFDMSDTDIIKAYRGLWEIEETFRISKGELSTRPIYVSREDHIEAHFLSCFISLVVIRLLQKITGKAFSAERIADCLNRISCSVEQDNIYLFDYRSDVSDSIGDALGINFSRKRLRLGDMKKILGSLKK
jgi:transposase